jgi:hypothetical protein
MEVGNVDKLSEEGAKKLLRQIMEQLDELDGEDQWVNG